MKVPKRSILWLTVVGALLLSMALLVACQPAETVEPTPIPPTPVPPPDQTAFFEAWENGVHGDTYDLGKGPNDYCSRCHSPQNWNPSASVGAAPTCVTCKFATDAELRIAETMAFVSEEDWKGIPCATCHQLDDNGTSNGEIAWLNPISMGYEPVAGVNALCEKCHANTSGVAFTGGRGVTHRIDLGGSAHLNYAGAWPQSNRPDTCVACHDPHSGEPKTCQDCHTDIAGSSTHMMGLNAVMLDKVECMACHDASGLDVGPLEEGGVFTTIVTATSRSGATTTSYVHSHSIQWAVTCDRCHFADNPWTLQVLKADGTVPATP